MFGFYPLVRLLVFFCEDKCFYVLNKVFISCAASLTEFFTWNKSIIAQGLGRLCRWAVSKQLCLWKWRILSPAWAYIHTCWTCSCGLTFMRTVSIPSQISVTFPDNAPKAVSQCSFRPGLLWTVPIVLLHVHWPSFWGDNAQSCASQPAPWSFSMFEALSWFLDPLKDKDLCL